MGSIYEEIKKFAEHEKAEAEKVLQTEENQVCIKADSYVAKEIKYQTALLHQILDELKEQQNAQLIIFSQLMSKR